MSDQVNRHGIRTEIRWEDGVPVIRRKQDVRALLAQNARERQLFDPAAARRNPARMRQAYRLPWIVVQQLEAMGIMQGTQVIDEKRFRQIINSNEFRNLRVDDGRPI